MATTYLGFEHIESVEPTFNIGVAAFVGIFKNFLFYLNWKTGLHVIASYKWKRNKG